METNEVLQENNEPQSTELKSKTVYQADLLGFFLYSTLAYELALAPDYYNIPFGAYEDEPLPAPVGMVNRRSEDLLAWVHVEDHRDGAFWVVGTGQQYAIGSAVSIDGVDALYDGGGPVPDWLTDVAPVITPPAGGDDLPGDAAP